MANVVKSHEAESPKWTSFPAFHTDNLERMMEALKIISFRLKTGNLHRGAYFYFGVWHCWGANG